VDIFFVISGYLITRLISGEYRTGRFSLIEFYERRIRRILPAFLVVTLFTLAVGAVVLLPSDLSRLGSSAVAATLFASNFYFWKQEWQNYLLDDTGAMPLLHTWSLSIEEQFYVIFPLFTIMALRFFKARIGLIFFGVALCSFALSVYLASSHPRAAFYFTPARAWELLLGAWLTVLPAREPTSLRLASAMQAAGLVMILVAVVSFSGRTIFPGFAALLPCVGTALIIAHCGQDTPVTRLLSYPALVFVGLISYPLYLWHWPLIVLAGPALQRELHGYEIAGLYFLAGLLAFATWHYVEKPIRSRPGPFSGERVVAIAFVVSVLAFASGGVLWATHGLQSMQTAEVARILAAAKDHAFGPCQNWDRVNTTQVSDCTIGDRDRPDFEFALWGDSHAGAIGMAVGDAARSAGKKGLQFTADCCPPLLDTEVMSDRARSGCEERNELAFDLMRQLGIRRAILAGAWVQYTGVNERIFLRMAKKPSDGENSAIVLGHALKHTVQHLRDAGVHVTIIGPVPEMGWSIPAMLAQRKRFSLPLPDGPSLQEFMRHQHDVIPLLNELERDGVEVIYPHEWLCTTSCKFELNGAILYSDTEHLTTRGADLLRPAFERVLSSSRVAR
jgi:peptidoglycan/LPS O-acetylase OafA/YrhL